MVAYWLGVLPQVAGSNPGRSKKMIFTCTIVVDIYLQLIAFARLYIHLWDFGNVTSQIACSQTTKAKIVKIQTKESICLITKVISI